MMRNVSFLMSTEERRYSSRVIQALRRSPMEYATVHVLCARKERETRPVVVSSRRPPVPATQLQVEREALALGHLFVLYRGGRTCKVLTASVSLERMETLLRRFTKHAEAYAIARVPVVESY